MLQRRAIRTVTCLAIGTGLVAGGCSAGAPFSKANDFDRTFISAAQTWDLDKNGSVGCDEWVQYLQQSFREFDANGDGALDNEEYAKLVKSDRLFEAANIAYKLVQQLASAEVIGPIVVGMRKPVFILQPSDEVKDIVNLAAIAAVECQRLAGASAR